MIGFLLSIGLGLVACTSSDDSEFARFNGDDSLTVAVTASTELGAPVSVVLTSTTGAVEVGEATVDPGSGPVGTQHTVTVNVASEYEDEVSKVVVNADAGDRGVESLDLVQDSADHGLWQRVLTSEGTENEERTDTFTFLLYADSTSDTDE